MMQVIKFERVSPFDVDGTLVMHEAIESVAQKWIQVYDPIERKMIRLRVNEPMVRLLKEEFHRGAYVIVWSRGGWDWAVSIVNALELSKYVHLVSSKMMHYFDDKPVEEWAKDRVYIGPDTIYKK